jgi:hypothetical protein
MSASAAHALGDRAVPVAREAAIPWYIAWPVVAVTSAIIGMHWDISWHRTIGRDTFWTPAHFAIYICGVIAGIVCGGVILQRTFSSAAPDRAASVRIWGFRGPLGAFIAAWGGIMMLTSAPFDDWWHNAYGLDVKVLSPPHVMLILGILCIQMGSLILLLGRMNRATGKLRERLNLLFLYVGGVILNALMVMSVEYLFRPFMHSAIFYRAAALSTAFVLAAVARSSGHRWAATIVASIYSAIQLIMLWVLPLFSGEPKLGPVYRQVTSFVPMEFPVLLIIPALLLDVLWTRTRTWARWKVAILSGMTLFASLIAAQWPFANFLNSPAARNAFFGALYFDYMTPVTSRYARYMYIDFEKTAADFWSGMAIAVVCAIAMSWLGLACGDAMRKVRR